MGETGNKMIGTNADGNDAAELTEDQKRVMDALMAGQSVFLTGYAGTGKSFLLEQFTRWAGAQQPPIRILLTASTGAAAQNIGGQTIHSVVNWTLNLKADRLPPKHFRQRAEHLQAYDVLVVDEVSMLTRPFFRYLYLCLRNAPELQLIFIGDFFQLSPVNDDFITQMPEWVELNLKPVHLTTVVRQSGDRWFAGLLNELRIGRPAALRELHDACAKTWQPNAVNLCARARTAREINLRQMEKLSGQTVVCHAEVSGDRDDLNWPTASFERELTLRVGMRVMITMNNRERGYFNGSMGTLAELPHASGHSGTEVVCIRLERDDRTVEIPRHMIAVAAPVRHRISARSDACFDTVPIPVPAQTGQSFSEWNRALDAGTEEVLTQLKALVAQSMGQPAFGSVL